MLWASQSNVWGTIPIRRTGLPALMAPQSRKLAAFIVFSNLLLESHYCFCFLSNGAGCLRCLQVSPYCRAVHTYRQITPIKLLKLRRIVLPLTMPFAQLVIGPPGSGKSTYCDGMHQFMSAIGRKCSVVNLDPANDHTSYPCALDVRDLVTLEEIMADDELGPNGAVLYALEELEENWDWLEAGLKGLGGTGRVMIGENRS